MTLQITYEPYKAVGRLLRRKNFGSNGAQSLLAAVGGVQALDPRINGRGFRDAVFDGLENSFGFGGVGATDQDDVIELDRGQLRILNVLGVALEPAFEGGCAL